MSNIVKIRDYHPDPAVRAIARVPRSWKNPVTKIVEHFPPLTPHGPRGPLYYEIPPAAAQALFSTDNFKRFFLVDPPELSYLKQNSDFTSGFVTVKAGGPEDDQEAQFVPSPAEVVSEAPEALAAPVDAPASEDVVADEAPADAVADEPTATEAAPEVKEPAKTVPSGKGAKSKVSGAN